MDAREIISVCRMAVVRRSPYLSRILMSLRLCPSPGLGTVGVDKDWRLWYDPEIVESWGCPSIQNHGTAAVLAHEVWHLLLDHDGRRHGRDQKRWNFAADREINDGLVSDGWNFPEQPLLPSGINQPNGLLAETYYIHEKQLSSIIPNITGCEAGNKSEQKPLPGCGGECASCTGEPVPGTQSLKEGEAKNFPSPVPVHIQKTTRRLSIQDTIEHIKNFGRGSMPAGLLIQLEESLLPPKIPWQNKLASIVRSVMANRAGSYDYVRSRIGRRYWGISSVVPRAPIVPAVRWPIPEVGVVLDTSGSMIGGPLLTASSEMVGIAKSLGAPIKCWAVDADIQAIKGIFGEKDVRQVARGGGGTDVRVGITAAEKASCDLIVVLTDGYTPWPDPEERRRAKLLACITPNGDSPPNHIPHIRIDEPNN